jgi:hypothetical protein
MESLAIATHHSGMAERLAIASKMSAIAEVLEQKMGDTPTTRHAWSVIAHSAFAVLGMKPKPTVASLRALDVPHLIRLALLSMRQPDPPRDRSDHTLSFLTTAAIHYSAEVLAQPAAIDFPVSCTHAPNIRVRTEALEALLRLCVARAQPKETTFDMKKLILDRHFHQRLPDYAVDVLFEYGIKNNETYAVAESTQATTMALMAAMQHGDLLRLGRELGPLMLSTEYAFPDGVFETRDPRTGRMREENCGLPFTRWNDALPHCARALREQGRPDEQETADTLECKVCSCARCTSCPLTAPSQYFSMKDMYKEAHALADEAIARYPRNGFFYYIRAIEAPDGELLRFAKKGLKCPTLTRYVK